MKCPKCGSEHIGYDDLTIACCTEYHCDWNEFTALTAERDALAAQLAALKKRVADAERVVALGYVEHSAGKFFLPSHGVDKYGTYALVRLEDGE